MRHLLRKICNLIPSRALVVVSSPILNAGQWQILRGDKHRYWFERFDSEEDAKSAARLVIDAVSMGAGFVDAEVVRLSATQIATVKDVETYKNVIAEHQRAVTRGTAA
jgi:hypothetical protein